MNQVLEMPRIRRFSGSMLYERRVYRSMKAFAVPLGQTVRENRKASVGTMVLSALLTLVTLSVLAAFSPKAMLAVAGIGFAFLLVRFLWLVWRELK
jgi:hypothetical protein